jgi:hypothetical protein
MKYGDVRKPICGLKLKLTSLGHENRYVYGNLLVRLNR